MTTLALTLNVVGIYENKITQNNLFLIELYSVLILFFLLEQFYEKTEENNKKGLKILSFLFSLFLLFGNSYLKIDSWNLVLGNLKMMGVSLLLFLGHFFFLNRVLGIIDDKIEKKEFPQRNGKKKIAKWLAFFEKHPFSSSFVLLLVAWLIYMIAFYPIILSPDPSFQIKMFFNEHTKYIDWVIPRNDTVFMTTHHPVIHTFLLGGCIKLGRVFGSDNLGLFFYSLLQTITLALTLSYTISYTKKINLNNTVRLLLLAFYALTPMFPFYAMSGVKDTYYTCFVILYTLLLFDLLLFDKKKKISWKKVGSFVLVILLMSLFRNNGVYVFLLSFPFVFLLRSLDRKRLSVVFLCSLLGYLFFTKGLVPALGISEGSIREVLSIPFQQTARYAKYHEEEVTKEEQKSIDRVLGWNNLKERYQPTIADSVKNNYNKYTTKEDLKRYFEVWWQQLLKHPDTYIQATMNNVYGYFYPNSTRWYIYYKFDSRITQNNLVDYHYNSLSGLRETLSSYGVSFPYIPGLGMLCNIGFCSWVLFYLVYFVGKRRKELLLVLAPSLISLLICVASPVNCYFRYAMPYVWMIPFLAVSITHVGKKKEGFYEKRR